MMNIFYHDRISLGLETIENALSNLNYGEAKAAVAALAEIRNLADTTYELSKHAESIWADCAFEIVRKLDSGYTIRLVPPSTPTTPE